MARDTVGRTFLVAAILCVVCSVLVSSAAVGLRPRQEANKELDRQKNILLAAGIVEPDASHEEISAHFEDAEPVLIDLETGQPVSQSDVEFNINQYEPREAAQKVPLSAPVEPPGSLPGIVRREKYAFVYLVKEGDELQTVVLPIYGKGLWSTLRGFLALDADLKTIRGITFYEHKETPGLGGEVDNPNWKALWSGKLAFDQQGKVAIEVLKGHVAEGSPDAKHQVDGLSGATITTRGVSSLVQYWLGPDGFGLYLHRLHSSSTTAGASAAALNNDGTS